MNGRRHLAPYAAALCIAPLLCTGTLVATASGAAAPAAASAGTAGAGSAAPTAYVTNYQQDTVTVLEGAHASGTIANVGSGPRGIAATPDGRRAYVADAGFVHHIGHTLTPINLVTGKAGKPITVGTGPMAVALTPDGHTAVVTLEGSAEHPGDAAVVVNLVTDQVSAPIVVGMNAGAVVVAPDGDTAYVASLTSGDVTPIDLASDPPQAEAPIALPGTAPSGIAVAPDGQMAYVVDAEGSTIIPIDLATDTPGTPTPLGCAKHGCSPTAVAIAADGETAYVVAPVPGDVKVVSLTTMKVTGVLPTGEDPDAVGTDAGWLYATNGDSNTASVFDAGHLVGTPDTGTFPDGVAVVPGSGSAAAS